MEEEAVGQMWWRRRKRQRLRGKAVEEKAAGWRRWRRRQRGAETEVVEAEPRYEGRWGRVRKRRQRGSGGGGGDGRTEKAPAAVERRRWRRRQSGLEERGG